MKIFYTLIFCWLTIFAFGQKLGPYTISSTGQSFQTEEVSLYVSIGEPINTMITDGEIAVSQGILQVLFSDAEPANPPCATINEGKLFFESCDDGQLYFFIKTADEKVYDPYFADGVNFPTDEEVDVKFGFIDATFESPCSVAEKAIIITCIEPLSVPTNIEESEPLYTQTFEVLPNPSQNTIKVLLNQYDQKNLMLRIFDYQGKTLLIKQQVKNEDVVDISSLVNGMYFMAITDEFQQTKTIKLIKQ